MIEIVEPTSDHVFHMAPRMRYDDKREIWRASRGTPHTTLLQSIDMPGEHYTALQDGQPIAMFGVSQDYEDPRVAVPWLLGTDQLTSTSMALLRYSRRYVDEAKERYQQLYNYVDVDNTASVKWLGWLGFDIYVAEPVGPFGALFHYFENRKR